ALQLNRGDPVLARGRTPEPVDPDLHGEPRVLHDSTDLHGVDPLALAAAPAATGLALPVSARHAVDVLGQALAVPALGLVAPPLPFHVLGRSVLARAGKPDR